MTSHTKKTNNQLEKVHLSRGSGCDSVDRAISRLQLFAAVTGTIVRYASVMTFPPLYGATGPSAETTASICPPDLNALVKVSESVSCHCTTVTAGEEESSVGTLEAFLT